MIKKTIIATAIIISIIFPMAKALAVVPALLLFTAPAVESTFVPWAAGIATAGVAAFAAWIMIQDPEKPSQTPLTIQLDPNKPLITPPGWTNPNTPPNNTTSGNTTYTLPNPYYQTGIASIASACQIYQDRYSADYQTANGAPNPYSMSVINGSCQMHINGENRGNPITPTPNNNCPTGYTSSGTNCTLDNPGLVIKPIKGKDEIQRVGNTFARDPQQNSADNNNSAIFPTQNSISYTNDKGEKITITLNPTSGAATVSHSIPDTSTGTTKQYTTALSTNGSSTGTSQQTFDGIGTLQTNTPTSNGTTFPNDYSRQGEAASAAKTITDKLDPLTSNTGAADGTATNPEFQDGFTTTFAPISGWRLPQHTSTCPTTTFRVWDKSFTLNSQCEVFNEIKTPLSYAMISAWVVAALLIVLGA